MPVLGPSHTCWDPACPALPTGRPLPTSRVTHRGTGNVSLSVALLRPFGNLEAPAGESGSPPRPLRPSSGRNPHSYGNFCPNWNWRGQRPLQLRAGQGRDGAWPGPDCWTPSQDRAKWALTVGSWAGTPQSDMERVREAKHGAGGPGAQTWAERGPAS